MRAASPDYRELARRRLAHLLFEYIDGGASAEVTVRRNVADLEAILLRQTISIPHSASAISISCGRNGTAP